MQNVKSLHLFFFFLTSLKCWSGVYIWFFFFSENIVKLYFPWRVDLCVAACGSKGSDGGGDEDAAQTAGSCSRGPRSRRPQGSGTRAESRRWAGTTGCMTSTNRPQLCLDMCVSVCHYLLKCTQTDILVIPPLCQAVMFESWPGVGYPQSGGHIWPGKLLNLTHWPRRHYIIGNYVKK